MQNDIMAVVKELQDNCLVNWRVNTTFLALVLKVDNPSSISDYRPISSLHEVYKILAKF